MKSNKKKQKSKEYVLNLIEINLILNWLDNTKKPLDKFVFVCLTYGGFRASELTHMQKSWIHIDDEYSKRLGVNYVQIPETGEYCNCRDCKLQHFLDTEAKKDGVKYTKEWYSEIRKTFDYDISEGRYWQPKTLSGNRKIPVVYDIFKEALNSFYHNNNQLTYSRQWVWGIIHNISKEIWKSKTVFDQKKDGYKTILNRQLYPHALRATAASLWAFKGINATALKSIMGWSNIEIADIYVKSDETQALLTAKNIADKEYYI